MKTKDGFHFGLLRKRFGIVEVLRKLLQIECGINKLSKLGKGKIQLGVLFSSKHSISFENVVNLEYPG